MSATLQEFHLGPTKTDWDKEIALREIETEINQLLGTINDGGIDVDWSQITNTPTTIAGYGITDAYTKTEVDTALAAKLNRTGYTLGDVVYADTGGSLVALPGQITATKKFLSQTGTGAVSAVPSWEQVTFTDISGSITYAQLPSGGGTWANGGNLTLTGGTLLVAEDIVIGHTASVLSGVFVQILGTATNVRMARWNNAVAGPTWGFIHSRGVNVGDLAILQDGDQLGNLGWYGDDGTDFGTQGARIQAVVSGVPAVNRMPAYLGFSTAAGLSDNDIVENMRLDSLGALRVGPADPGGTFKVRVDGSLSFPNTNSVGGIPQVVIGHTAGVLVGGTDYRLQVHGTTSARSGFAFSRWSNNTAGVFFSLAKSRSATIGTPGVILQNDDTLAQISWYGDDGVDLVTEGSRIIALIEGTPAANRMPTVLNFMTAEGASDNDIATKFSVGPLGNLGILSGKKIYFDGVARTGDTYLYESAANVLDTFVGGTNILRLTGLTLNLNGAAGTSRDLNFQSSNVTRWQWELTNTAESGSDAGSDLTLSAWTDAGVKITNVLALVRATGGAITVARPMMFNTGTPNAALAMAAAGVASPSGTTSTPNFQAVGAGGGATAALAVHGIFRASANATGPGFVFTKARGTTVSSVSIVLDGDRLGSIVAAGADGVDLLTAGAEIRFNVSGTPAANRIPTSVSFYTAAGLADDDISEKLRLGSTGALGIISGQKIYLDGVALTGNTYLTETSADVFNLTVGGATAFQATASLNTMPVSSLVIGHTAQVTVAGATPLLQVVALGSNVVSQARFSANASGPSWIWGKSRGATATSFTAVVADDQLGNLFWVGADGTDLGTSAIQIRGNVDGAVSANRVPGRIEFWTAAGSADDDIAKKWLITSAGHFLAATDNSWDVGAAAATRPRRVYVGTGLQIGTRPDYTITNPSTLRSLDVSAGTLNDVLKVLGTVIQDFIDREIFQ